MLSAQPNETTQNLTWREHLQVLTLVAGLALFTLISMTMVVIGLATGEIYGSPGKNLPTKLLYTVGDNPIGFYGVTAIMVLASLLLGCLSIFALASYLHRLKLDRKRLAKPMQG